MREHLVKLIKFKDKYFKYQFKEADISTPRTKVRTNLRLRIIVLWTKVWWINVHMDKFSLYL